MKDYIGGVLICWVGAVIGTLLFPIVFVVKCYETYKHRKVANYLKGAI